MNDNKVMLTYQQACDLLPSGERIHTFRQAGPCLIGADWDRTELLDLMRVFEHTLEQTGEQAQSMKHGLALRDRSGVLFIETKASQG
jgi:hypothetical protein